MVIQFVLESIRNIPQVYREQKIFFFITLIILLISTVYHFRYAVSLSSRISQPVLKVIVFAGELLGSLALMLSGAVFISASEIAKLNPEMLNHRFFLELILCAILYCLYSALLIYLYQKKEEKLTAAGQWTKDLIYTISFTEINRIRKRKQFG